MFVIWRQFVAWLRTLLLAIFLKQPIDWHKTVDDALDIAKNVNDKTKVTPVTPTPTPIKPTIPDYDLVGPTPKPRFRLRDLFKNLRKNP